MITLFVKYEQVNDEPRFSLYIGEKEVLSAKTSKIFTYKVLGFEDCLRVLGWVLIEGQSGHQNFSRPFWFSERQEISMNYLSVWQEPADK